MRGSFYKRQNSKNNFGARRKSHLKLSAYDNHFKLNQTSKELSLRVINTSSKMGCCQSKKARNNSMKRDQREPPRQPPMGPPPPYDRNIVKVPMRNDRPKPIKAEVKDSKPIEDTSERNVKQSVDKPSGRSNCTDNDDQTAFIVPSAPAPAFVPPAPRPRPLPPPPPPPRCSPYPPQPPPPPMQMVPYYLPPPPPVIIEAPPVIMSPYPYYCDTVVFDPYFDGYYGGYGCGGYDFGFYY